VLWEARPTLSLLHLEEHLMENVSKDMFVTQDQQLTIQMTTYRELFVLKVTTVRLELSLRLHVHLDLMLQIKGNTNEQTVQQVNTVTLQRWMHQLLVLKDTIEHSTLFNQLHVHLVLIIQILEVLHQLPVLLVHLNTTAMKKEWSIITLIKDVQLDIFVVEELTRHTQSLTYLLR